MTSERTRRLKYIRRGPLYSNLQWNREPILLSSRANLCGTAPLNSTSTAAEIATEVLGRRLTFFESNKTLLGDKTRVTAS